MKNIYIYIFLYLENISGFLVIFELWICLQKLRHKNIELYAFFAFYLRFGQFFRNSFSSGGEEITLTPWRWNGRVITFRNIFFGDFDATKSFTHFLRSDKMFIIFNYSNIWPFFRNHFMKSINLLLIIKNLFFQTNFL